MRSSLILLLTILSFITPSFAYQKLTPNVPVQNILIPATQSTFYEIDVTNRPSTDTQINFILNVQLSYATFVVTLNGTDFHASKLDAKNSMLTFNLTNTIPQNFTIAILNTDTTNLAQVSFVATTNRTIQLTQNAPQFVQLHLPDITDFYFTHQWQGNATSKDSFYCLISNEINANYSIYATFDGTMPSPSNWQWNSTSYDVDEWRDGVFWTPVNPAANALIQILVHLEADNYNTHAPILVEALRISPSDPITLALFDGQESPMLHMRGETLVRMTFNATQVHSQNLFVSIVKETGSLIVYVLSPDDMSVEWPSADHYTAMLELDWGHANSTTLQTNSAGIWRIVAVNTLTMHASSSTLFSVVVSSFETPISIPGSEPVAGMCSSSNVKAFYSLVVPDVSHDTTIYIRPTDGLSYFYQGGITVVINTEPLINPNTSIIGAFTKNWDHLAIWFSAHDPLLVTCDQNAGTNNEPCVLYIQVSCANLTNIHYPVNFVISVQRHGDVMPIDVNDQLPQITSSPGEAAHFSIAVSDNDRPVHITAYPCTGRPYLYASLSSRYPSNSSSAPFKSQNPYAINQFTIPQEFLKPNGTTVFLSVKAVDFRSKFILRTMSYDPSEHSPFVAPRSLSVQANSVADVAGRLMARWIPPTLSPSIDPKGDYDILYDIYSEVYADVPAVYWSRCGWGNVMPTSVYQSGLTLSPDGYYEFPIDDLVLTDISVINVFASFVNRTSGRNETWYEHELVYTLSTGTPSSGSTPVPHHDSSDAAEIAEILAAVFLPLFLLAGAVAYYFHRRNKRLQEELSLSLPDIENLDTMVTPASDRRQRGTRVSQPMNGRRAQHSDRYSLMDNDSLSGL